MREVVHVTTERGWRGGERQLLLLARELAHQGVRQRIAAPAGSAVERCARSRGLASVALAPRPSLHPVNLARLLRAVPPGSVLHAHTSPALGLAAVLRRLRPEVAVVYTRRTGYPVRPSGKYRRAADLYVAVSSAARARLEAAGTPVERLVVVPDAVDPDHLRPELSAGLRAALDALGGPLVVSVGCLSPEKGHRTLLEAWPWVLRELPRARLAVAGDGPEWTALLDLVDRLGIGGSVRLLGFVEPVGGLLSRAALLVMPSRAEGLGSAVLEAAWAGVPAVASAVGGLPEAVVDGVTGVLVPPGDPRRLAEAVVDLLRDPERRRRMGRAAAERVRRWHHPRVMAERYAVLYARAAGEPAVVHVAAPGARASGR